MCTCFIKVFTCNIIVVKAKAASTGNIVNPTKAVVINEAQVDLLLEMLKTADITSTNKEENKTLKDLEGT